MSHPTSIWAARYGLADPAVPANGVLDARPDRIRALATRSRVLAQAALEYGRSGDRARAVVRGAWSARRPALALAALVRSDRSVGDACAAIGASVDGFAATVQRCRQQVLQAYADADSAIAAQGLLAEPLPWPPDRALHLADARSAVVRQLYAAVSGPSGRLDDAALRVVWQIDVDPRQAVPDPGAASAAAAGTPATHAGAATADARNRARLAADLRSSSPRRRQFALAIQRELARTAASQPDPVQLLAYDPTSPADQGGVAIAIGAVQDADAVAVLIPGVGNSPSDLTGTLRVAADLVSAAAAAAPGTDTATVVWLGYDAPFSWPDDPKPSTVGGALLDSLGASSAIGAGAGGAALADFCRNLRGQMDPSAGLTLIGHSYGSTVVSQAATRLSSDTGVDDIVLLASPGVGFGPTTAQDYTAVPADHVYALGFPADPVPSDGLDDVLALANPLAAPAGGPFGADPGSDGFGAQVIDVASRVPVSHQPNPLTSLVTAGMGAALGAAGADPLSNLDQHALTNYLGGAALTAVAAVVVGRYAKVPVRSRR